MDISNLKKLKKCEKRIYEIASENGLEFCDIEFDIVPQEKMFEIMSYGMPGQISNWKFGRDYEKTRTIYEKTGGNLPMEVVFHTDPSRAYLMQNNSFAIQVMIIAHVVAHVAFFTMNRYFIDSDPDLSSKLLAASKRFDDYERKYGVDITEKTVDAGHAIMFHSSPFESTENEDERRERIFEQMKQKAHEKLPTEFRDMFEIEDKTEIERDLFNHNLYMELKNKSPVEPTEDILRYIIDNARRLAPWQKDILEIIRQQGQYYYPMMRSKYMNEGFATYWHEKIMRQLYNEGLLSHSDHAETNYSNSLVKARNPFGMNPYLIGSSMWEDIEKRWNKGQHGEEWNEIESHDVKKDFDDGSMKGQEQMAEVLRTHTDWMFMQNFLTNNIVRDLQLYIYMKTKDYFTEALVIADKDINETKDLIVKSFSHSGIPKILVQNGNYEDRGILLLQHEYAGIGLHPEYAKKTLEHIAFLWNDNVLLKTQMKDQEIKYKAAKPSPITLDPKPVGGSVSSSSGGGSTSTST